MPHKRSNISALVNDDVPAKERTIRLVRESIQILKSKRMAVSIRSIVEMSKTLDGHGVCKESINRNEEAKLLYLDSRTWRPKLRRPRLVHWRIEVDHIRTVGDLSAKRRRLGERYRKVDLIDIIIALQKQQIELEEAILRYATGIYESR